MVDSAMAHALARQIYEREKREREERKRKREEDEEWSRQGAFRHRLGFYSMTHRLNSQQHPQSRIEAYRG